MNQIRNHTSPSLLTGAAAKQPAGLRRYPVRSAIIALAVGPGLLTCPALAADPFNGERLAERWCAACHVVTANQSRASADAPPFAEIAKRPAFSESGLTTFLLDPHAKMPNMNLSRIEAGDIAAYIARLR